MGNTPSKNVSTSTAMTPELGASSSVLASTDDGDESIGSGSSGGNLKFGNASRNTITLASKNSGYESRHKQAASGCSTHDDSYQHFDSRVKPQNITYPTALHSCSPAATADYYYPPSSVTTLSSSISSVATTPSTSSSLSSYSQGSASPSLSSSGKHSHANGHVLLGSDSPVLTSSATTSGTVTPLLQSPLINGSDLPKSQTPNYASPVHQPITSTPVFSPSSQVPFVPLVSNSANSKSVSSTPNHDQITQQSKLSKKQTTSTPSQNSEKSKKQHAVDVNELIQRLLDAGLSSDSSKTSRKLCITNNEIIGICRAARSIFLSQPTLLELGTPVQVVGDIHGQYGDLMRVFQTCGMPPHSNYLFLGDYVDRGKQSIETMLLLLCFKIRYPENIFLLRGNHECASVTKVYGFYDECKRRASVKIWKSFVDTFNTLPIAATIGGKIFCVHGGLSPYLNSLDDIRNIQRPSDIPDIGLLSDLLWSDPDASVAEWSPNDRGVSYCFGSSVVDNFCSQFNFDLIARGHMVVEDGYEFFNRRKLVTVFSAPNYCGEFGNWAAVMSVGKDLLCRFELLKPLDTNGVRKALKDSKFVRSINTTRATSLKHQG